MSDQDAASNYQNVYGHKIGYGKRPALVLVDYVEAYFDKSCDLYAGVEENLASALRIRAVALEKGIPVFLTRVVYHKSGVDGGRFFEKAQPLRYYLEGSPYGAWPKGLVPTEDEIIINKQYPSAFFGTSMASTMTAMGLDSLIITGLTTSGCVRATCVDASSHGFIPIVVREACGDRHPAPHEANLFDMHAKYGDVVLENEVIEYLKGLPAKS